MNESILETIKLLLGIVPEDTSFDTILIDHINTVFGILTQLALGPEDGYHIESSENTWSEYTTNEKLYYAVKSYISKKVQLMFDPPSTSFVISAVEREISELEWRLNVMAENDAYEEVTNDGDA